MPDPTECFTAIMDHLTMTGRRFPVAYSTMLECYCEILESRKAGLNGAWLTVEGETTADAFMRRLQKDDPTTAIFEAYVAEFKERWEGAKALSMDEALAQIPEIERLYGLECEEYNNILYGVNDELSAASKTEIERL